MALSSKQKQLLISAYNKEGQGLSLKERTRSFATKGSVTAVSLVKQGFLDLMENQQVSKPIRGRKRAKEVYWIKRYKLTDSGRTLAQMLVEEQVRLEEEAGRKAFVKALMYLEGFKWHKRSLEFLNKVVDAIQRLEEEERKAQESKHE